ncbi:DUF389 domain-containing protein [Streptomyces cyaneofuscatus]|uniref:DUF389 domain-containing protein n=1 Tax=Streptomyces cyaneofuscatus TaxID=66883 RepID=UPI0033FC37A4
MSLVLPSDFDLLSDSQISSRTSPGLMDLIAALATGFAGAVALARRDVAAVLPGVAIAISLVPPLVVVGVCLGQLSGWLALGALVLFVSNLFALVFGGMVVFASLGYGVEADKAAGRPARGAYAAMALLFVVVFVPLTANTVVTVLLNVWTGRTKTAAEQWLADEPGASVTGVDATSRTMHVHVRTPGDLPPLESLLERLEGRIPDGIPVVVDASRGRRIDVEWSATECRAGSNQSRTSRLARSRSPSGPLEFLALGSGQIRVSGRVPQGPALVSVPGLPKALRRRQEAVCGARGCRGPRDRS